MKIKFPIGDWSDDGHGKCVYFLYESNKSVEEVREIHFKIKEVFGFDISDFANDYEDDTIPQEYIDGLAKHGIHLDLGEDDVLYTEDMARIWTSMLVVVDPELSLELVDDDVPMIVFYGYDHLRRHIRGVGYGLFHD